MSKHYGFLIVISLLLVASLGCYAPRVKEVVVPPHGYVTGKISDAETDEALGAEIKFPLDSASASVISDPATGIYKIELPVGVHRIRVEKEGYSAYEVPIEVTEGRTILLDAALEKKRVDKGTLTGKVTDASTGEPVGAMITFPGTSIPQTASDLRTGIFKTVLPPGTYVVTATAQGYLTVSSPVVVPKESSVIQNFELRKQ
jgi:hypothetical protein